MFWRILSILGRGYRLAVAICTSMCARSINSSAAGATGSSGFSLASGTSAGSSAGIFPLLFLYVLVELQGGVFERFREAALFGSRHPAERLEGDPGLARELGRKSPDERLQRGGEASAQNGDCPPQLG